MWEFPISVYQHFQLTLIFLSIIFPLKWKLFHPYNFRCKWLIFHSNPTLIPMLGHQSFQGQHEGALFIGTFLCEQYTFWETCHIFIQNFKMIGVRVLSLIRYSISIFLINMELPHTCFSILSTHTCFTQPSIHPKYFI